MGRGWLLGALLVAACTEEGGEDRPTTGSRADVESGGAESGDNAESQPSQSTASSLSSSVGSSPSRDDGSGEPSQPNVPVTPVSDATSEASSAEATASSRTTSGDVGMVTSDAQVVSSSAAVSSAGASSSEPSANSDSSSADTGYGAACGGVTRNGRCDGNVYEWCDYFTRQLQRLDCSPLAATCRAEEVEVNDDEDANGCKVGPCDGGEHCEGPISYLCGVGGLVASDCRKKYGPDSTCYMSGNNARCTNVLTCDEPSSFECEGPIMVICNEEGVPHLRDCGRKVAGGTCAAVSATFATCGGVGVSL